MKVTFTVKYDSYFYWLFKEKKLREDIRKKVYSLEAELSTLKEERESFQLKLEKQKGRISLLVQQNKSLQTALDEKKKKEVCSFLLNSSKMIYNYTAAYS
jgi:chromosome segregation ATPase